MTSVFLMGAGPGDPELLTLKAFRLLQAADVVLHDSLVDARVVRMARAGATVIDVGKRCGRHCLTQGEICALLVAQAQTGATVVRLKGGDPGVFGRMTEEIEALRASNIAFEIVPGVTAAAAAAAALELSLTRRNVARSLHFLTGHGAEGGLPAHDWTALAASGGTLAVYMGGETFAGVAAHLIEAGMDPETPAIAIENASLPSQRYRRGVIGALPRLMPVPPDGPVLILIGEALRDDAAPRLSRRAHQISQGAS